MDEQLLRVLKELESEAMNREALTTWLAENYPRLVHTAPEGSICAELYEADGLRETAEAILLALDQPVRTGTGSTTRRIAKGKP
jgi:hypothetical protein